MSIDPDQITEIVAIDGPAGAGKSSVARRVAQEMGFAFLDTGAMYRAATWWALDQGIDLDDADAVAISTRTMPLEMPDPERGAVAVLVGGQDITGAIRDPSVTRKISKLDGVPGVRAHLVQLQREIGGRSPTVAEGRDMGTVVFPGARCKIFLDSDLDTRVGRRILQLDAQEVEIDRGALKEEMHRRDESDRNRAAAPLHAASDAFVLDASSLPLEDVVAAIVARARAVF